MSKSLQHRGWLIILLLFLNVARVNAQVPSFTETLDYLLNPLDKSRITTGILYERVKPLANIDIFNSNPTDPYISNLSYFNQAYFELYGASYNKTNWLTPKQFHDWVEAETIQSKFNIGILDYLFNMIDSNAVPNGLLTYSNGQFYDVPNAPSPYYTKRLQLSSILADEIPSGLTVLKYNPSFFKTNQSVQVGSIILNFGNIGIYTLTPVNDTATVNFTGSGILNFNITINYTNGTSFSHTSEIQIGANINSYSGKILGTNAPEPNVSFWVSSKYAFQGYEESQPYYGKAKISIWWKVDANEAPIPGIRKPIIIVDGFDPFDDRKDRGIYDLFSYTDQGGFSQDFAFELRKAGFDIIVMDMPGYSQNVPIEGTDNDRTNSLLYPNQLPNTAKGIVYGGGDYIQRNAYSLEYLIDYVNASLQQNNITEKIIVVGPSMGGQITRYALRDMENQPGVNHNCKLWVSFDSPHQGAYVPLGIQYSVNELAKNSEKSERIRDLSINSPAAQQMMIHHYKANSPSISGVSNFYYPYYSEINSSSFGFPQATGLRRIAMVNGSDLGVAQSFGTACQLATKLEIRYKPKGFLNWLLSFYVSPAGTLFGLAINPIIEHSTYLAPATGQCNIFKLNNNLGNDYIRTAIAPSWNTTSFDLVQGGHIPVFNEYKNGSNEQRPEAWYKNYVTVTTNDYVISGAHELTYSTMGIGLGNMPDPNRKWDDNFRKVHGSNLDVDVTCPESKESPFDMYWAPDVNTKHDSLLLGHVIRMRREIIDGLPWPRTKYSRPLIISPNPSNPQYICPNVELTFNVTQPIQGSTYTWSFSNPSLWQVVSQPTPSTIVVKWLGGHNQGDNITVNSESECFQWSGSYYASFYLASELPLQGNYIDAANVSHRLEFNQVNGVNGGYAQGQVAVLSVGSNYYLYTLLNNPATPYTWSQFRNQFTINAQPSFDPTNKIFQYRIDYAAPCNAGIRSKFFDMFFYQPRGRFNNSESSYTIDGNELLINLMNPLNANIIDVVILDLSGRVIKKAKGFAAGSRIKIDISGVANGIYLIRAIDKQTLIAQKVFINK